MKMNCLRAARTAEIMNLVHVQARMTNVKCDNGYLPKLDFITVSAVAQD